MSPHAPEMLVLAGSGGGAIYKNLLEIFFLKKLKG